MGNSKAIPPPPPGFKMMDSAVPPPPPGFRVVGGGAMPPPNATGLANLELAKQGLSAGPPAAPRIDMRPPDSDTHISTGIGYLSPQDATSAMTKVASIPDAITGTTGNAADKFGRAAPIVGGAIGGIVGSVPGAAVGGAAGNLIGRGVQARFGTENVPPSPSAAAIDTAWEGLKQGAYELGGRILGAVGGRAVSWLRDAEPEAIGTTIKGTLLPETMGQSLPVKGIGTGVVKDAAQTAEHYLSGTYLGRPLKAVQAAQEDAAREVMNKLANVGDNTVPTDMAMNWAKAREVTRATAAPLYDAVRDVPVPNGSKVAGEVLDTLQQSGVRLSAKANQALSSLAVDPSQAAAESLGFKTAADAQARTPKAVWDSIVAEHARDIQPATSGNLLQARHELGDLAAHAKDANDRRMLQGAWHQVNDAINSALTPEQQAIKAEGDKLWRRSYIMDRVSRGLESMENRQDPTQAPKLLVRNFVTMVNKLARSPVGRDAEGNIVRRASDLDVLFDSPADRKAMIDLAHFLSQKYSTLHGAAGIGESIARIAAIEEPMRAAASVVTNPGVQSVGHLAHAGLYLAGLFKLSDMLANPGGAKLVMQYFRGVPGAIGAQAVRAAGSSAQQSQQPQVGLPGPPPAP